MASVPFRPSPSEAWTVNASRPRRRRPKPCTRPPERIVAFVNCGMPPTERGACPPRAAPLGSPLRMPLSESMLQKGYTPFDSGAFTPPLYGGQIPTDMQGMYWYGLQG